MANEKPKLSLKPAPDAYGFLYGDLYVGEDHHTVNILPPKHAWAGDYELDGYRPHDTDWVVYLDGEEIARVTRREDIETAIVGHIPPPSE